MKRQPFGISPKKRASASASCIATSRASKPLSSRSTTNCRPSTRVRLRTCRPGRWRDRFVFALKTSLDVLKPHQVALRALTPVLVGDPEEGIFSASTAFSRLRVQQVFEQAVIGSSDAPKQPLAAALGRLLYLVHLAVLLWWLLDKSSNQRATAALVSLTQQLLPSAALTLRVPPVRRFVISVDELVREALFGSPVSA